MREMLRITQCGRSCGEIHPRGHSKPEHRGLCQALWYLQDDTPLPEEAWTEGVKEGLSGFVALAARSPDEDGILKKIEDEL